MKNLKRMLCLFICIATCAALAVPAAADGLDFFSMPFSSFEENAPYVQTTMDQDNIDVVVDPQDPMIMIEWVGKGVYMNSYNILGSDDSITLGNVGLSCDNAVAMYLLYKREEGSYYKLENTMPIVSQEDTSAILVMTEGRGVTVPVQDLLDYFGITGKEKDREYLIGAYLIGLGLDKNDDLEVAVSKMDFYEINDAAAAAIKAYPFDDVDYGSYCWDSVQWALDEGVTKGISKTSFGPRETCTRGQVATFLWRALGSPEPQTTENPFKDIKESDYYYKPILWAYEKGITNGTSKTEFSPNGTCTSAHVVTFLWRANGKPAAQAESTEYYAEAVAWANEKGLLEGVGATFKPENNSPRADIVTYLYRNAEGK